MKITKMVLNKLALAAMFLMVTSAYSINVQAGICEAEFNKYRPIAMELESKSWLDSGRRSVELDKKSHDMDVMREKFNNGDIYYNTGDPNGLNNEIRLYEDHVSSGKSYVAGLPSGDQYMLSEQASLAYKEYHLCVLKAKRDGKTSSNKQAKNTAAESEQSQSANTNSQDASNTDTSSNNKPVSSSRNKRTPQTLTVGPVSVTLIPNNQTILWCYDIKAENRSNKYVDFFIKLKLKNNKTGEEGTSDWIGENSQFDGLFASASVNQLPPHSRSGSLSTGDFPGFISTGHFYGDYVLRYHVIAFPNAPVDLYGFNGNPPQDCNDISAELATGGLKWNENAYQRYLDANSDNKPLAKAKLLKAQQAQQATQRAKENQDKANQKRQGKGAKKSKSTADPDDASYCIKLDIESSEFINTCDFNINVGYCTLYISHDSQRGKNQATANDTYSEYSCTNLGAQQKAWDSQLSIKAHGRAGYVNDEHTAEGVYHIACKSPSRPLHITYDSTRKPVLKARDCRYD